MFWLPVAAEASGVGDEGRWKRRRWWRREAEEIAKGVETELDNGHSRY